MSTAQLIFPEKKYLPGYLDACREIKLAGIKIMSAHDPDRFEEWKDTIFTKFENDRHGINLPEGYVPATAFWLVEDGRFIGCGNIRHRLTPALVQHGGHIGYYIRPSMHRRGYGTLQLSLLLGEAYALGIDKALLTCDDKNIASWRVMEKNGGVLWDTIPFEISGEVRISRRYWLDTVPK